MRRNAIPLASDHFHRCMALAIVLLLVGCGKHSAGQEVSHKPHSVTLSWVASTSKVVGYNVYRSYSGTPFLKLTPRPVSTNQYIDATAEGGKTYTYYVTSVDSKGAESQPSAQQVVAVPSP